MATFSFTGTLPQFKAPILSAQLRNRFNDLGDWIAAVNALGLTLPTSVASAAQYDALLLNSGKTGFDFAKVFRSDTAVALVTTSLSTGDLIYYNGTNFVRVAVGSSGTTLKLSGTVPTWTSVAAEDVWTNKTSNFTTANGGRYQCSSGVTSIALHSPAVGDEFSIKASIGNSFTTTSVAFTGTPLIAGAASTAYTLNEDVIYYFVSNGTDYDVSAEVIER